MQSICCATSRALLCGLNALADPSVVDMTGLALRAVLSWWASLVEVAIMVRHLTPKSASVWVALLPGIKCVCVCSIVQYKLD